MLFESASPHFIRWNIPHIYLRQGDVKAHGRDALAELPLPELRIRAVNFPDLHVDSFCQLLDMKLGYDEFVHLKLNMPVVLKTNSFRKAYDGLVSGNIV